ncbi:MAG: glutathione S-transferase family protein [Brevundimonas sp.]|uniref:glutathione S-transferase family protein n=1 Tax=Brevundimonas sp. TaxID=1871086 RepID=UPI00391A8DAA
MLTLFHAPRSRSSRLVWLIEELGADCRIEYCDIQRMDGTGARDPRNPHPDGKVPALVHDGALISESAAVALYLTGLHPEAGLGFPPESPQRGPLLTWICWTAGELEPAIWSKASGATQTDPRALERYEAAMARLLEALWVGPCLMGDTFTVADVMIGSTLAWAREHLPESPLIDDYLGRLQARPAHQRAMARDDGMIRSEAA